jgi:integrase
MTCPAPASDMILLADAPPEKGGLMQIWHKDINGTRWYFVDRSYVRGDGKSTHYRRKTDDPVVHARQVIEAQSITGECSLTSKRFSECVAAYLSERGAGGFSAACYDRAVRELGRLFPDKNSFAAGYAQYAARLEASDLAVNTANNYKIVVRSVCNYAHKTKRCCAPAVTDYCIRQGVQRSRVLSPGERLSLENKLREWDSHLLQPFLFALENPIRKTDLFNLRRDDLRLELVGGTRVWTIRFAAKKTRRKASRGITVLANISRELLEHAASLPGDCPWLFPMVGTERNGMHTKLKTGAWKKIIDADRHFNNLLDECNIHDFHFHDLKHCAETHMLKQGYHYEDMAKLGIQMSPKTQKLYDNRSQVEIVARVLSDGIPMASERVVNE